MDEEGPDATQPLDLEEDQWSSGDEEGTDEELDETLPPEAIEYLFARKGIYFQTKPK